jgi:hypothetical protein
VLQFAEGPSDRQAADAVRGRIDWKYVMGLELTDAGFDYSVLSEFRERLLSGGKEATLLEELLVRLKQQGLLTHRPALPAAGTWAGAGAATHGFDTYFSCGATTEPCGDCGRDAAPSLE